MDIVNSGTNTGEQSTELYIKKVLAGDIENVRLRLIAAMETMGYDIIDEEPNIIGRRGAKSWATWYGSADVLDYPTTLTVRLKPLSKSSTRATFDYMIKHPSINRGEQQVVLQEAKTIASISKIQAIEKMCSVCETESTDDSRFCRRCGAPLTSEQAELEVLRMTAETRAGKTSVVGSTIVATISSILVLLTLILSATGVLRPKHLILILSFSLFATLVSAVSASFGWNRLKRALEKPDNSKQNAPKHIPHLTQESVETGEFKELPPRQPVASITEGTTNLLDEDWANQSEREKVPVPNQRETNDL